MMIGLGMAIVVAGSITAVVQYRRRGALAACLALLYFALPGLLFISHQ